VAGVGAVVLGTLLFFRVVEGPTPARLGLPAATRAATAGATVKPGPLSGTWTVAKGSQAGYRVQELLFGVHNTAVGRTSKVSGTVTISGHEVTAANFQVAMATVDSGVAGRDVMWRNYIMSTSSYPTGRFYLTRPISLSSVPPLGKVVSEPAAGALELRGITRPVYFTVRAERIAGGVIDVNAEIPIVFSRWRIPNPSFIVAKVGNDGTLEVLLHLVRG